MREIENLGKNIESKAIHMIKMNDNIQIQVIYVSGMGADWTWLTNALSQYLNIPIHRLAIGEKMQFVHNDPVTPNAYVQCACAVNQFAAFDHNIKREKSMKCLAEAIANFFFKNK